MCSVCSSNKWVSCIGCFQASIQSLYTSTGSERSEREREREEVPRTLVVTLSHITHNWYWSESPQNRLDTLSYQYCVLSLIFNNEMARVVSRLACDSDQSYLSSFPAYSHFDFTRLFMITKRAREADVQSSCHFLLSQEPFFWTFFAP